jgi:RHS repeat-associated protein
VLTIDHTRGNQATLNWLLYDGHGNLVRLMAPDYTLSGFQWRGVWGERESDLNLQKGYCANLGHPEDETGLVYMRARYYEPATGRFLSEDPAGDGVNWYLYADGNPVGKVDVDGQVSISEILRWLAAAIGAGLAWEFIRPFFGKPVQLLGYALLGISLSLIRAGNVNVLAGLIELRAAGIGGSLAQSLGLGLRGIGRTLLGAGEIALGLALRAIAYYIIGVGEGMLPEGGE